MTGAYDAVIIGGGPAGLSAALVLGRCRRRVVLVDSGRPRNAASRALHGFLTRDGVDPLELRRIARRQLSRYSVELVRGEVVSAARRKGGFTLALAGGRRLSSRTLLFATGVVDRLPTVDGLPALYGRAVFHCPYCDGWEVRDRALAVYGRGKSGAGLALSLKTWSRDVTLLTDGPARLSAPLEKVLAARSVSVIASRVARLDSERRGLDVVFRGGERRAFGALFFSTGQDHSCDLPRSLGCRFTRKGAIRTDRFERTGVPGLYVAGDASRDVQLAIVAASEGAKAAFAINRELQEEEGLSLAPLPR
ncbi:MAG TPA: NAD(P)/FAD-dependent oxidoreductase [Thermoanaerobaculia bacterium]|nr:NAD(P)/FAD-dependent oxidoreductase [Thermoanaerobaculia bacterium]